ncbi:MAG: hypothetical protein ABIP82_06230 [Nitrospirales bacterium]
MPSSYIQPRIWRIPGLTCATSMNLVDGFWVEYEIGPHTLAIEKEPFLKPSGDGLHLVL